MMTRNWNLLIRLFLFCQGRKHTTDLNQRTVSTGFFSLHRFTLDLCQNTPNVAGQLLPRTSELWTQRLSRCNLQPITMNPRTFSPLRRTSFLPAVSPHIQPRLFSTSTVFLNSPTVALPVQKPIGAFRGGWVWQFPVCLPPVSDRWLMARVACRLFGFLFGSVVAGASVYYYILKEYRMSNEMLTEDIYVRYCIWREPTSRASYSSPAFPPVFRHVHSRASLGVPSLGLRSWMLFRQNFF